MQKVISISTKEHNQLVDITTYVEDIVLKSGIYTGMTNVYVKGATAGIMIQENWDYSVQTDVINWFKQVVPHGVWSHDLQDNNGDSHLKAGIVGPSETIPIINGKLGLSRWQNIFVCEFDGPRQTRDVVVTLYNCK
ncbi:secondary thiamine-phosphate synthase enzyme YjbQ [Marinilabiliaceae bacterium ANBcel2]|nr:secondary thiamine-phosphate synthase enzyme YjbQ [Marinilabiliaceae bacterium ANBcel2]